MIEEFAKSMSLNIWDWAAVIVALSSLFVAVKSYIIAFKTLKSQQQTAENTLPVFTKERQYEVFRSIEKKLVDNYLNALTILSIMENDGKDANFSYLELVYLTIDISEIHIELFYADETAVPSEVNDEKSVYMKLYNWKNSLILYNQTISRIVDCLLNPNKGKEANIKNVKYFILDKSLDLLTEQSRIILEIFGVKKDIRHYIVRDIHAKCNMNEDYTKKTIWVGQADIIKKQYINEYGWNYLFKDYNIKGNVYTSYLYIGKKFKMDNIVYYLTNAVCSNLQKSSIIHLFQNSWWYD